MSSSRWPTALALGVALAALGTPSQASAAVSLSATRDARFPERSFVVTLPEHTRLAPGQVRITENGAPVHALRTVALGAARRAKLGVVLAIDASSSMVGEPYAGAYAAARAFADKRNPHQPFALMTFSDDAQVVLPFTTDGDEIGSVLGAPGTPAGGTHMYDAALRAVRLVRRAGLPGGFVVLLSDGTDHGSVATSQQVVDAARAANVRIYAVGLQSTRFDPSALTTLAVSGGGEYSEATSVDQLQEIYRALGAQLSNAHVLSYRSLVRPGRHVNVRVVVEGLGAATATYEAPGLALGDARQRVASSDLDSPPVLAAVVAMVVALLAISLWLTLRPQRTTARQRVEEFVQIGEGVPENAKLTERLAASAERSFANADWWERFTIALDIAGIRYSAGQLVVVGFFGAVSLTAVIGSLTGTAAFGSLGLVLVPLAMWLYLRWRVRREQRIFADQLADHLAVVGGSLRVGHGLPGALAAALDEAPDPVRREFARATADERLGKPLEDALELIGRRMKNREIEHVALLAKLQREAGADAAEMVDQVVATVREREDLRRTVRTLTAQGRFSQLVLTILPLASLLFLTLANGDYVAPLYHTSAGHLILGIAAAFVVAGSLVIRRIVSFNV
jgi:tight adherence protein B